MAIKISSLKAAEIIGIKHDDLLHYVNSVIAQNKPVTFIKRTSAYDMPAADAYRVAMATNKEACDRMAEYWDRELEEARNMKICQWLTKNGKLKKIRKLRYKTIY